jgi:hypothetical protein
MKRIQYWAIASLLAPLGLVVGSCYQDPAETTEPGLEEDEAEYSESNLDQEESTEESTEETSQDIVCKPLGWPCYSNWECCGGGCLYGVCRGVGYYPGYGYPGYGYPGYGYPYRRFCQVRGQYCSHDFQCCSGNCRWGVCRGRFY